MGFIGNILDRAAAPGFWRPVDDIFQSSGMNEFYGQAPAMSAQKNASLAARYPNAKSPISKIDAILTNSSAKQVYRSSPSSGSGSSAGAPSAGAPSDGAPSQPQTFDYLDAPWASAYGMSRETAYSEAMENTAYRRSVEDMKKAGLNPAVIYGAGNGYTAGSPTYVRSAPSGSSGSGGRSSYRGSGRGSSKDKLFSSSAYAVMSALGGIAGAAATRSVGGYWLGVSLTQGAMNALNLLSKR